MEQQNKTQPPPIENEPTPLVFEELQPDYTPLPQEDIDENPFFKMGNILDTQGRDAAIAWLTEQMKNSK